jgi:hypothetical protein
LCLHQCPPVCHHDEGLSENKAVSEIETAVGEIQVTALKVEELKVESLQPGIMILTFKLLTLNFLMMCGIVATARNGTRVLRTL